MTATQHATPEYNYTEARVIQGASQEALCAAGHSAALLQALQQEGFSLERQDDVGLRYVLLVVYDPVRQLVVGLLKQRGPSFLLGKITFPGGKLEGAERPEAAASRELREETGLVIPEEAWKFVCRSSVVSVLATVSQDVLKARQGEEEPVFVLAAPRHLEYAKRSPDRYVPDFSAILEWTLATLS